MYVIAVQISLPTGEVINSWIVENTHDRVEARITETRRQIDAAHPNADWVIIAARAESHIQSHRTRDNGDPDHAAPF